jgi:hypothetical protein
VRVTNENRVVASQNKAIFDVCAHFCVVRALELPNIRPLTTNGMSKICAFPSASDQPDAWCEIERLRFECLGKLMCWC